MTDTDTKNATGCDLRAAVEARAAQDPDWLADVRREALARYEAEPLPPRAEHLWRYTAPERLLPGAREIAAPSTDFGEIPAEFQDGTYEAGAGFGVCRDGVVLRAALDPAVQSAGVTLCDIREAAREHEDLVRPRLFGLARTCDGGGIKFDSLSGALFNGGGFVHVPRGVVVERAIKLAHRVGGSGLIASRSMIILEDGAEATVVIDSTSMDAGATLIHSGLEVYLGQGSRLRLVGVQRLGRKVVQAPITRVRLARDAKLETISLALGGALVKSLQTASLEGPGAEVRVLGLVFGDGRQHFDHHTFQDHRAPHSESHLDYRTVSGGRARSAYTGRLRITPEGTGCNAHQKNYNLLLSDKARADTIPELEILTSDVSCSHAATVGPIDEEQVYYCTSRGLDEAGAQRAIVLGFLEPGIASIPAEDLQEKVRGALAERLESVV